MATTRDDRVGGYLFSAIAFTGITALWAWIVRDDPYYSMTELLGLSLPVATLFYLTLMPLLGFTIGRWQYQRDSVRGNGANWIAKQLARLFHFLYSHILIVLFTVAMVVDYFFGWNMDTAIRNIDDGLFDIAQRFAPWLSAYLAGYNLGRLWGLGNQHDVIPAPSRTGASMSDDNNWIESAQNEEPSSFAAFGATAPEEMLSLDPTPTQPAAPSFAMPITDLDPRTNKPKFSRLR